jgi:AcrR family transcriptional regulator
MARPSDPFARQRLLQAARSEFVENGLDRAKVEQIAHRANVSKGAFYLHFKSKAEAFSELVHGVMTQLTDLVCHPSAADAPGPDTAASHLQTWFEADLRLFEFLLENRDVVGLILEGGGSGTTQHLIENLALHAEKQTAANLATGIALGLYRSDLNIEISAAFIAGGYDRVARRLLSDPENHDLPELIRTWQRQVVSGVGTPALVAAASPDRPQVSTELPQRSLPQAAQALRKESL